MPENQRSSESVSFDPRTCGSANLSTLVNKSDGFEVRKAPGKPVFIRHKAAGRKEAARSSAAE